MRDWKGDLEWYRNHQTTAQIGFNPDGMCLAICRTSREIPPQQPSAAAAAKATPQKFRVHRIRDLRKGMKIFVDDPNDSNKFGHIVTMAGRVKGFDWDDPNDVIVWTNSVVSGKLVKVRLTYFQQHWGDKYQFGAFYLNGYELDYPGWKHDGKGKEEKPPKPKPNEGPVAEKFKSTAGEWDVKVLDRAVERGNKLMGPKIKAIEKAVQSLPKDDSDKSRVSRFRKKFKEDRVLDMSLLNDAVEEAGRTGAVKTGRDNIRAAIKSVLWR